jgi:hypothetical protein
MGSSSPPAARPPTDTAGEHAFESPIPPVPKPRTTRSEKAQLDRP